MALNAAALIDFGFSLVFASRRYREFAESDNLKENSALYTDLAQERSDDAERISSLVTPATLGTEIATINSNTAGQQLGLGKHNPSSSSTAAHRVQRAENTLDRMAAQLESLADPGQIRSALQRVRERIGRRRDDVRQAKVRAQSDFVYDSYNGAALKEAKQKGLDVTVWYATNRRSSRPGRYLGERNDHVSYGRCSVFVPEERVLGSLGSRLFGRILLGDNRIKLSSVEEIGESLFWSNIAEDVASLESREKQGLVFLHGYCTKFEDAARRTAQLKVDLGHKGPAAFFSWPSLGSTIGYTGDEAAIEGSEVAIQKFLVDFANCTGVEAVHIIAHSMGNRGLVRAMDAISKSAATSTNVRFGQVFMAAPDVDVQLFQNLAAAFVQLCDRPTLYVTSNDKAIGLSRWLHRYTRVGITPPVSVLAGIDTIDASSVNLGLLGHGYAAEMRPVLSDIHQLIQSNTPPDRRFGLRRAVTGGLEHWQFAR